MAADQGEHTTAAATFEPKDRSKATSSITHAEESWTTVLESRCTFDAEIFTSVMLNLVKNPNLTSTYLFRADIFYDSENDTDSLGADGGGLVAHLKPEYRPVAYALPGFTLSRTIVRQLVPRNPQVDAPLVQTCHFYEYRDERCERNMVVYVPHVDNVEEMPFYHPSVAKLAFEHTRRHQDSESPSRSPHADCSISISYSLFPSTELNSKLERTALRLLQTLHRHGQGRLSGYEKRVHLDQIVPQKRYQDTYTRLKTKYGKRLSEQWVEVTDPGKHVFEDIGIAAFLIELWRGVYGDDAATERFPRFVDIGCGNGVLVYILLSEGYKGWGFDARERKTWSIYPDEVRRCLETRLLIPEVFDTGQDDQENGRTTHHNGIFTPGTFIISNHADELTAWTPLLAFLNDSAFIAIPCCSHDLSGSRFRAPSSTKSAKRNTTRLPQQQPEQPQGTHPEDHGMTRSVQAAETGSLKRTEAQKKMPSAYATLCSYVSSLTEEVGFVPETDVLRIPSTRNNCIVGRRRGSEVKEDVKSKRQQVIDIVERELGRSITVVGQEWIERAEKLAKKPGSGH